jgi:hypothetical protein
VIKPTVGRIVHYQSYGTPCGEHLSHPRAAMVTEVIDDETVGLVVFNPTGLYFNGNVPFSSERLPGHWSWPPKVES